MDGGQSDIRLSLGARLALHVLGVICDDFGHLQKKVHSEFRRCAPSSCRWPFGHSGAMREHHIVSLSNRSLCKAFRGLFERFVPRGLAFLDSHPC